MKYVASLDGLRAVAISLVVLHHLSYSRFPGGKIGVDIFFVLSGFLISSVLLREIDTRGTVSLPAFYIRRILRLVPALVLMVACEAVLYLTIGGPSPYELIDIAAALSYTTDFLISLTRVQWVNSLSHTWSLSVEEQFYILWPILIICIVKFSQKLQTVSVIALFVLLFSWRCFLVLNGAGSDRIEFAFDTRSDVMLLGCALAVWLRNNANPAVSKLVRIALWPCIAFMGCVTVFDLNESLMMRTVGQAFLGCATAVVVFGLVQNPSGYLAKVLCLRPLVQIGKISYGIYLWHWPLLLLARYKYEDSKVAALLAIGLAVCMASLSYRFVELPFLKLKHRFEPASKPGLARIGIVSQPVV